jgi:hypothetical protein
MLFIEIDRRRALPINRIKKNEKREEARRREGVYTRVTVQQEIATSPMEILEPFTFNMDSTCIDIEPRCSG